MSKTKFKFDIWFLISTVIIGLYALFLLYPLFRILNGAFVDPNVGYTISAFEKFFSNEYYSRTLINSFSVTVWVTLITLLIGYPLAYFYNFFNIKFKGFLQVIIILCSMSAPFISAYAWIQLLGRGGIITTFIRNTFGFDSTCLIFTVISVSIFIYFRSFKEN